MPCSTMPAREVGLVELDFQTRGECLIRFLGLVPELAGHGHGRWLFAQTLALAWRAGRRDGCGSTPARSTIRPRCPPICAPASGRCGARSRAFPTRGSTGLLPRDAAPQIPLLD